MATTAFVTTFREQAFVPSERHEWDDLAARLLRYAVNEGYYSNVAYSQIESYAARLKADRHLYKHIRGIYNPVNRLVEFYVAKCAGGPLDFETLEQGAVPLLMASPALKAAVRQTWLWSNWRSQKNVYVRTGAKLGDVFLWVTDEPARQKVRLEVVDPAKIRDVETDGGGNVTSATLDYVRADADTGRDYRYRLEVDKDWFRTFRDGQPYAYAEDAEGNDVAEWPNPYGFVPLVHTQHRDMGLGYGTSAFHGIEPKIDEVNDAASILNDAVRKSVNILYYAAGVSGPSMITPSSNGSEDAGQGLRDEAPMLYGPKDSVIQPLTPQVNIADAGANVDRLLLELERDAPELALHRLRESGSLTAPGVRAGYGDAIERAQEAQGNYDDGYIRAQKMAISIGGMRRYAGFEGFDLDSYDQGDLEFFIRERPVIGDDLSRLERVNALRDAGNAPTSLQELILEELDIDAKRIRKIIAEQNERQEALTRAAARGLADGAFGDEDENDDNDTETPEAIAANASSGA